MNILHRENIKTLVMSINESLLIKEITPKDLHSSKEQAPEVKRRF